MDAINKAIDLIGGPVATANVCGVSYQAVQKWRRNGVPAEKVLMVYRATGGQVTPHELRPDIYPDPKWLPPLEDPKQAA